MTNKTKTKFANADAPALRTRRSMTVGATSLWAVVAAELAGQKTVASSRRPNE